MANLVFQCSGTPPFHICYHIVVGKSWLGFWVSAQIVANSFLFSKGGHNITQNETCPSVWEQSDHCNFVFTRFFYTPDQRSVLVFLKNHVSEHIGQVGLQFYESKLHNSLQLPSVGWGSKFRFWPES